MKYTHDTHGKTCTNSITVELDEKNCVKDIIFSGGGCKGNLLAIRGILLGKDANFIIEKFKGIPCGNKGTSCADQLALCVKNALELQNTKNTENCYFREKGFLSKGKHECRFYNDICEDHPECLYRTDVDEYNKRVENHKNLVL